MDVASTFFNMDVSLVMRCSLDWSVVKWWIELTDILVLLGDLNARVGVLDPGNRLWEAVIGKHGKNERNAAGEGLLQFCSINQLS